MCETVAGKSGKNNLRILETFEERLQFTEDLRGKRVLHVKGFGKNLRDSPEEEQGLDNKQKKQVLKAVRNFAPEFLVVDGDPWGEGFHMYMKQYIDRQQRIGRKTPTLIWARSATLAGEHSRLIDDEERKERLEQAKEWAAQGFPVVVFWVCMKRINQEINKLFGHTFVEDNQAAQFDARGLVQIMADPLLPWVQGLGYDSHRSILRKWRSEYLLWNILIIECPDRGGKQYFQKCSFENAAMGNLIFDLLHSGSPAEHGVVCCGGDERVLLEIATKYLNQDFEALHENVAIFPFSQGGDTEYPPLPDHVGLSFTTRKNTLTQLSRHHPSNCNCSDCFTEAVKSKPAISLELPIGEALESTPAHDPDTELLIEELSVEEPVHAKDSAPQMEEQMDSTPNRMAGPDACIEENMDFTPATALDSELCIEEQLHSTPAPATDSELTNEISKVDDELERGICDWIELVTLELRDEQTMQSWLKSGEVLFRLIKPGSAEQAAQELEEQHINLQQEKESLREELLIAETMAKSEVLSIENKIEEELALKERGMESLQCMLVNEEARAASEQQAAKDAMEQHAIAEHEEQCLHTKLIDAEARVEFEEKAAKDVQKKQFDTEQERKSISEKLLNVEAIAESRLRATKKEAEEEYAAVEKAKQALHCKFVIEEARATSKERTAAEAEEQQMSAEQQVSSLQDELIDAEARVQFAEQSVHQLEKQQVNLQQERQPLREMLVSAEARVQAAEFALKKELQVTLLNAEASARVEEPRVNDEKMHKIDAEQIEQSILQEFASLESQVQSAEREAQEEVKAQRNIAQEVQQKLLSEEARAASLQQAEKDLQEERMSAEQERDRLRVEKEETLRYLEEQKNEFSKGKGGKDDNAKGGKDDYAKGGKDDYAKGGKDDYAKGGKDEYAKGDKGDFGKNDFSTGKGGKDDYAKGDDMLETSPSTTSMPASSNLELEIMQRLLECAEHDGWEKQGESGKFSVSKRNAEPEIMWRFSTVLTNCSPNDAFEIILDCKSTPSWSRTVSTIVDHGKYDGARLLQTCMKSGNTALERLEFRAASADSSAETLWIGFSSEGADKLQIPVTPRHERRFTPLAGYRFELGPEPNTVAFTHFSHQDARERLPDWKVHAELFRWMDCCKELQAFVDKTHRERQR